MDTVAKTKYYYNSLFRALTLSSYTNTTQSFTKHHYALFSNQRIMRGAFSFILFTFLSITIYGQQHLDSLQAVVDSEVANTTRLAACEVLTKLLIRSDSARAERYFAKGIQLAEQLGNEESKWNLHLNRGLMFKGKAHYDSAIAINKRIVDATTSQTYPTIHVRALQEVGSASYRSENYTQALVYYEKSFEPSKKLEDEEWLARAYNGMSYSYRKKGDYAHAITYSKKSLELRIEQKNETNIAKAYNTLAILYHNQGNITQALNFYQQYYLSSKKAGNKTLMISALHNIGIIHLGKGNYAQAIEHLTKSLKFQEEIGNKKHITEALLNLADVHRRQGNFTDAQSYLKRGLKLSQEVKNRNLVASCLSSLGYIYDLQGNTNKALEYFRKSLKIRQEQEIPRLINSALYSIGTIYLSKQMEDSAFHYLNQSIEICKEMAFNKTLRSYLITIGAIYHKQGQIPKSLNFYYDALKIVEETQDTIGMAAVYKAIASVHFTQDNYQEALSYQYKTLEYYQASKELSGIAQTQNSIAHTLGKLADYRQAIHYSAQALKSFKTLQDSCQYGSSLLPLGRSYYALQEVDSAIIILEQARTQVRKCLNYGGIALVEIELGKCYTSKNQTEIAFRSYERALVAAQHSQNRASIQEAASYLYPVYQQAGQYKKAFEVLNLYQANKDSLFNETNTRNLVQKEMQYEHDKELKEQELQQIKQESQLARQRLLIYSAIGACVALFAITLAVYRNYRNKNKANQLLKIKQSEILIQKEEIVLQNEELRQQQEEIISQRNYIEEQNVQMTDQYQRITDSIRYAQTIQQGVLPFPTRLEQMGKHFIIYRPKDIVSGDFYWYEKVANRHFFAVADCTGHGVPGGFMSMLGIAILNELVLKSQIYSPADILTEAHRLIQQILNQKEEGSNQDGMDVILATWEENQEEETLVTFCGAKRPLFCRIQNEVEIHRGVRQSIGGRKVKKREFIDSKLSLPKGSYLYFTSDGYADQSSRDRTKIGSKQFTDILVNSSLSSPQEQKEKLITFLDHHQEGSEQRDDITVVGICLK